MPHGGALIEFHGPIDRPIPRPFPASQHIPEWFKRIPGEAAVQADGKPLLTIKRCPPFVDALTNGYLIPLADDVRFTMEDDGLAFSSSLPIVRTHPPEQLPPEWAGRPVVKFLNPWIVKTPPGYSCMFVQPLNRLDPPFHILSGIVETDTYYQEVHFPAICLLQRGASIVLRKGTPIVQVFPVPRLAWDSSLQAVDMNQWKGAVNQMKATENSYRVQHWQRKDFR